MDDDSNVEVLVFDRDKIEHEAPERYRAKLIEHKVHALRFSFIDTIVLAARCWS